ncbi:extracellular serine-rich [Pyrenophora seminiperda CCB06]|uniref:Extracellular serine-rich n=1 Tax=Pyrenophora seminiperda CCB06 TaxID=1302712 RepID=A0A3M7M0D2_9PLEO|nr:extracellular serine-rich [Pyrenophora seminiperda CCB06]
MHFSTIFAASAMASAALAAEHTVSVSDKSGALIFKPDTVQAAQGDTVVFHFWPKNHSIAQSTFAKPCEPMADGMWSGFVPTTDMAKAASTSFTYEVKNASAPIWFYCSQGMHCQGGMVGVINPPAQGANTIDAFKKAAASASSNVSPQSKAGTGGKLNENGTATSGSGSSATKSGMPSMSGMSGTPQSTGAASQLGGSVAFAGLTGLFTFFML